MRVKEYLLEKICQHENAMSLYDYLIDIEAKPLARMLIEGVPLVRNTLTNSLVRKGLHLAHYITFTLLVIPQLP